MISTKLTTVGTKKKVLLSATPVYY